MWCRWTCAGTPRQQFAELVAAKLARLADGPPGEQRVGSDCGAGWPLAEVTDPFALEVHRPVQPEDPQPGLPALPTYVPREHDTELGRVVRAAAEGRSGIAVLVGGSSTGKTRACWEALQLLRDRPEPWRLWHPIDPSRPDAALRELPGIGPRTVVWLNEAQFYLDVADGRLGERVAAGLRELLRDPARAPVLVLATLWPQFWDEPDRPPGGRRRPACPGAGTAGRPRHHRARRVHRSRSCSSSARRGTRGWPRPPPAAQDGQVIQFLAGAPELLARYRNAPPAAAALIHAAMDARRLGMGIGLPQAFLEAAAPGYLTDDRMGRPRRGLAGAGPGLHRQSPAKASAGRSPASVPARPDPAHPDPAPGTAMSSWQAARPASGRSAVPARGLPRSARPAPPKEPVPPGRLLGRGGRPRLPRRPGHAR